MMDPALGAMPDLLSIALNYAARGWPVIPLWWPTSTGCACGASSCPSAGKHPYGRLVPHGLSDATTDAERVRRWWSGVPKANVGIVLGKAAGMFAVDTDPKNSGDRAFDELVREHAPLGPTLCAITGSGGRHFFFRWPGRAVPNSTGKLAPGVDVRGDGGYVVAAPSLHASSERYRWVDPDAAVLDAPPWLLAKVLAPLTPPRPPSPPRRPAWRSLPIATPHRLLDTLIKECAFIRHAIEDATALSYDEWFSLATVLHAFPVGDAVFDEISRRDPDRYSERETSKKIATIRGAPRYCTNLGWSCPQLGQCARLGVRSPAGLPYKLLTIRRAA